MTMKWRKPILLEAGFGPDPETPPPDMDWPTAKYKDAAPIVVPCAGPPAGKKWGEQ